MAISINPMVEGMLWWTLNVVPLFKNTSIFLLEEYVIAMVDPSLDMTT